VWPIANIWSIRKGVIPRYLGEIFRPNHQMYS
jgi:hypothetical protein